MINQIAQYLLKQAENNNVFSGLVGGGLVTGAIYSLRSIPRKIERYLEYHFLLEVEVYNNDESFEWVAAWIEGKIKNRRRLRVNVTHDYDDQPDHIKDVQQHNVKLTPAAGWFWFSHKGRLFSVTRQTDESPSTTSNGSKSYSVLKEKITIRTYGRDISVLKNIIHESEKHRIKKETLYVYTSSGYGAWDSINTIFPRNIDTVFTDKTNKQFLLNDIQQFLEPKTRQNYRQKGIPYRRGYLFYGQPGTGKTSFVIALATYFNLPLFVVNIGSVNSDSGLIESLRNVPQRCICLIEDIDAFNISGDEKRDLRESVSDEEQILSPSKKQKTFSLSSLLNAIDGLYAPEDRILIMTSNKPDSLDKALLRPGRIDKQIEFGNIDQQLVSEMVAKFYGQSVNITKSLNVNPAEIQKILLENPLDIKTALKCIENNC